MDNLLLGASIFDERWSESVRRHQTNTHSSERIAMIDLAGIRESFHRWEIELTAYEPGGENPSNAMTKLYTWILSLSNGKE